MIEKAKAFVRSVFTRTGRETNEAVFSRIHQKNLWENSESASGRGSTVARTEVIRRELASLLEEFGARSLFDAACGDFNWMQHVALPDVDYMGADVVPELVACNRRLYEGGKRSFVVIDITRDQLPAVDVILCRDCLIHLSAADIHNAIANFKRSNSTFLLATTHTRVLENRDIRTGDWRSVNLQLSPFNFGAPIRLISEDAESGKCLGLWRLADL